MPEHTSPFHGYIEIEPPLSVAQRDFINSLPFPLDITQDGSRAVFSGESSETRMPALWTATLIDTYLRLSPEVMRGKAVHRRDQNVPDFTGHLCNGIIKCRGHHDITVLNNRVGRVLCYPAESIEWLNEPEDEAAMLKFLPHPDGWERPYFIDYIGGIPSKNPGPDILEQIARIPNRASFSALLSFSYRLEDDAASWLLKNHEAVRAEIGIPAMNRLLLAMIGGEQESRRFAEVLVPDMVIEEKAVEGDPGRVAEYVRVVGRTEHNGVPLVVDIEAKMALERVIVQAAITAWSIIRRSA
jgi:hypothetical protein